MMFPLGISDGCHTVLQTFQELKLVFSETHGVKVTNLNVPDFSLRKVYPQPTCLDFCWNSSFYPELTKCPLTSSQLRQKSALGYLIL